MKKFQGRVVAKGEVTAPALVSHGGLSKQTVLLKSNK